MDEIETVTSSRYYDREALSKYFSDFKALRVDVGGFLNCMIDIAGTVEIMRHTYLTSGSTELIIRSNSRGRDNACEVAMDLAKKEDI